MRNILKISETSNCVAHGVTEKSPIYLITGIYPDGKWEFQDVKNDKECLGEVNRKLQKAAKIYQENIKRR